MAKYHGKFEENKQTNPFISEEVAKLRKDRIKRGVGTIVLATALLVGSAGISIECNTDHTEDLCPYCAVLGYDHQINKINRQNENLHADYGTRYDLPEGASLVFDDAGNAYARLVGQIRIVEKYEVPEGYKLEKNLNGEWMGVARNASGEINGIADAKFVRYLEVPEGYVYENGHAYKDTPISEDDVINIYDDNQQLVNYITLK